MRSIVILGAYGAFGSRLAERLAASSDLSLVLAGRSAKRATSLCRTLEAKSKASLSAEVLDATQLTADDLIRLRSAVLVNASGPFQGQDYSAARAAIDAGCHYIDLADARAFVTGIETLDEAARRADVLVVSGASSVPGVSSAVVAHDANEFADLREIHIGISPGNSFDPGLATFASVLSNIGKPLTILRSGRAKTVYGWQGLARASFGDAGTRFMGYVDVPDLALFPKAYPSLRDLTFKAGLELSIMHLPTWLASFAVRAGLIKSLAPLAPAALAIKQRLSRFGSDRGGMYVEMRGRGHDGKPRARRWQLVAKSGHGPYVPILVASVLAKRLARGEEPGRGATPAMNLVSLDEIQAECRDLDMTFSNEVIT